MIDPRSNLTPSERKRNKLQRDALVGFLSTMAVLFVFQAVLNVLQPEPRVWPAVLALVQVILAVGVWRWSRSVDRRNSDRRQARPGREEN